jgi:hypothetical protein
VAENRKTRESVAPKVLGYMAKHPGESLFADDVAAELGLDRRQVQKVVPSLIVKGAPVTVLVPGNAWRYEGPKAEAPTPKPATAAPEQSAPVIPAQIFNGPDGYDPAKVFYEVGVTQNDEIIVRNADGTLFRLTAL